MPSLHERMKFRLRLDDSFLASEDGSAKLVASKAIELSALERAIFEILNPLDLSKGRNSALHKRERLVMSYVGTIADEQGTIAVSRPVEAETPEQAEKELLDRLAKESPIALLGLAMGAIRLSITLLEEQSHNE